MDSSRETRIVSRWRTASHSQGNGGNCVEVAGLAGGGAAVRDSKDRDGAALLVSRAAWTTFVTGTRDGRTG